jgi:hypothetical protein
MGVCFANTKYFVSLFACVLTAPKPRTVNLHRFFFSPLAMALKQQPVELMPDEELAEMAGRVEERLRITADVLHDRGVVGFLDATMREILITTFEEVGADEGTLWLADSDQESLTPVFNSGPHAADIVGQHQQPLNSGLVSMVYATEELFCEEQIYQNEGQSKKLDKKLGMLTCSMIAAPFYFGSRIRGVISAVKLKPRDRRDEPDPEPFGRKAGRRLSLTSKVLETFFDEKLMSAAFGLD